MPLAMRRVGLLERAAEPRDVVLGDAGAVVLDIEIDLVA